MTGFTDGDPRLPAQPTDPPDIGAICQYLGKGSRDLPGAVCLPSFPGSGQNYVRGGPYGGFLGSQYDPLFSVCDPTFAREPSMEHYDPVMPLGEPHMPALDALPEVTVDRFDKRRSVLAQLDQEYERVRQASTLERMDKYQSRAFAILRSTKTREAFDLTLENAAKRDQYGRNLFG